VCAKLASGPSPRPSPHPPPDKGVRGAWHRARVWCKLRGPRIFAGTFIVVGAAATIGLIIIVPPAGIALAVVLAGLAVTVAARPAS
jgi:hypothetical protein